MAAQNGRDLLLKLDPLETGSFVTVAGLRTRRLALNASSVDITSSDSAGRWRELLAQAGTRTASLAGSGLFRDQDSDAKVREVFFQGQICPWQVIIPDFGVLEGPFQVTALEYGGRHDGEISFEMALESAGELSFTADA
ncbi:MAG: phage major tail protein, TP901-1 family [Rhodobacteraceae bacterium]|nr:phage major tail protein, TP901-1 family [Paracoccaceae bacterium]